MQTLLYETCSCLKKTINQISDVDPQRTLEKESFKLNSQPRYKRKSITAQPCLSSIVRRSSGLFLPSCGGTTAVYRAFVGLQRLIALVNADRVIVRGGTRPDVQSALTILELIAHKTRRCRLDAGNIVDVAGMSSCGPLAHCSRKVYDGS